MSALVTPVSRHSRCLATIGAVVALLAASSAAAVGGVGWAEHVHMSDTSAEQSLEVVAQHLRSNPDVAVNGFTTDGSDLAVAVNEVTAGQAGPVAQSVKPGQYVAEMVRVGKDQAALFATISEAGGCAVGVYKQVGPAIYLNTVDSDDCTVEGVLKSVGTSAEIVFAGGITDVGPPYFSVDPTVTFDQPNAPALKKSVDADEVQLSWDSADADIGTFYLYRANLSTYDLAYPQTSGLHWVNVAVLDGHTHAVSYPMVDPTAAEVGFAYTVVEHTDRGISDPSNIVAALLVENTQTSLPVCTDRVEDTVTYLSGMSPSWGWAGEAGHTGLSLTALKSREGKKGQIQVHGTEQGILYTVQLDGVQMYLPACP